MSLNQANYALFPCACCEPGGRSAEHLDVLDELLCWRLHGGLGVDDVLHGVGPAHRLVQQLAVQAVRVLAAVHGDVPVA